MKHLLLAVGCSMTFAAFAQAPTQTLESLISAGTTWGKSSSTVNENNSSCPDILSFRALDTTPDPDNEDARPGDMSIYTQRTSTTLNGSQYSSIFGERILYRPNAPAGKSTLSDTGGFVLGYAGSSSTIENKSDRIILEHKSSALSLVMSGSSVRRITYFKATGAIEIMERATGVPEEICRFDITEVARQPESLVNSDRAVPREDVGTSGASRAPAVEASGR